MAMSTGGGGGSLTNDINVTPMIDVLLVLLIIFMMTIPMMRKAIDLQLPDPTPVRPRRSSRAPTRSCCRCCRAACSRSTARRSRRRICARGSRRSTIRRPDKIIFVKGDPTVKYQDVVMAMDAARGAGVKVIGIPPK